MVHIKKIKTYSHNYLSQLWAGTVKTLHNSSHRLPSSPVKNSCFTIPLSALLNLCTILKKLSRDDFTLFYLWKRLEREKCATTRVFFFLSVRQLFNLSPHRFTPLQSPCYSGASLVSLPVRSLVHFSVSSLWVLLLFTRKFPDKFPLEFPREFSCEFPYEFIREISHNFLRCLPRVFSNSLLICLVRSPVSTLLSSLVISFLSSLISSLVDFLVCSFVHSPAPLLTSYSCVFLLRITCAFT